MVARRIRRVELLVVVEASLLSRVVERLDSGARRPSRLAPVGSVLVEASAVLRILAALLSVRHLPSVSSPAVARRAMHSVSQVLGRPRPPRQQGAPSVSQPLGRRRARSASQRRGRRPAPLVNQRTPARSVRQHLGVRLGSRRSENLQRTLPNRRVHLDNPQLAEQRVHLGSLRVPARSVNLRARVRSVSPPLVRPPNPARSASQVGLARLQEAGAPSAQEVLGPPSVQAAPGVHSALVVPAALSVRAAQVAPSAAGPPSPAHGVKCCPRAG